MIGVAAIASLSVWWLAADAEASCDTDAGPSAVVAVSGDGVERWTRLLGRSADTTVTDGVISVESVEISTTLHASTGETISCRDLAPVVHEAQASTSTVQPPGAPVQDDAVYVEEIATDEWRVFRGVPTARTGAQQMHLAVETSEGAALWGRTVPGFVVQIAGDLLLAIDQTNGNGSFDQAEWFPTLLTAYDIRTGTHAWSTTIPGGPHEVIGADDLIAIPGDGHLHGLDPETGEILWRVELGNPGRTRHYSEGGGVRRLGYDESTDTIVAVVEARPEYHG